MMANVLFVRATISQSIHASAKAKQIRILSYLALLVSNRPCIIDVVELDGEVDTPASCKWTLGSGSRRLESGTRPVPNSTGKWVNIRVHSSTLSNNKHTRSVDEVRFLLRLQNS